MFFFFKSMFLLCFHVDLAGSKLKSWPFCFTFADAALLLFLLLTISRANTNTQQDHAGLCFLKNVIYFFFLSRAGVGGNRGGFTNLAACMSSTPLSLSSPSLSKYMSLLCRRTNQRRFQFRRDSVEDPPPFLCSQPCFSASCLARNHRKVSSFSTHNMLKKWPAPFNSTQCVCVFKALLQSTHGY